MERKVNKKYTSLLETANPSVVLLHCQGDNIWVAGLWRSTGTSWPLFSQLAGAVCDLMQLAVTNARLHRSTRICLIKMLPVSRWVQPSYEWNEEVCSILGRIFQACRQVKTDVEKNDDKLRLDQQNPGPLNKNINTVKRHKKKRKTFDATYTCSLVN